MGIFLKECTTSKSLSPVMIQEACAAMANSRNLLSFFRSSIIAASTCDTHTHLSPDNADHINHEQAAPDRFLWEAWKRHGGNVKTANGQYRCQNAAAENSRCMESSSRHADELAG